MHASRHSRMSAVRCLGLRVPQPYTAGSRHICTSKRTPCRSSLYHHTRASANATPLRPNSCTIATRLIVVPHQHKCSLGPLPNIRFDGREHQHTSCDREKDAMCPPQQQSTAGGSSTSYVMRAHMLLHRSRTWLLELLPRQTTYRVGRTSDRSATWPAVCACDVR